jgi:hypothetical protein
LLQLIDPVAGRLARAEQQLIIFAAGQCATQTLCAAGEDAISPRLWEAVSHEHGADATGPTDMAQILD